ncbi:MAG: hypothetical protein LBH97_02245 [Treponema sp.]|nr:hypothetical protein [Treponema sp.]
MPTKASERKIIYLQRKKGGYCPRCGNKVRKNSKFIYCEDCREYFRSYSNETSERINKTRKERYDERKEKNRCPRCGTSLGKRYGKITCPDCLNKQYKYNYGKKRPKKYR